MYENQFITYDEYQAALDHNTARILEEAPNSAANMYEYPYVEYAVQDVINTLLELNSLENTTANRALMENRLRTGGYHVYMCLDTEIQKIVEETLKNWDNYPLMRDPSDSMYRQRNTNGTYTELIQPQAAAVVLDYRTGELKAVVGGRTTPTARETLNRATDLTMPVGSAIKPVAGVPLLPSSSAAARHDRLQHARAHPRLHQRRRQGILSLQLRRLQLHRPDDAAAVD